ncbi:unnamed protein product [Ophioblennius macclurei]
MSDSRNVLQEALLGYTKDTLTYIHTVRTFCETSYRWELSMKMEVDMLKDIKVRADEVDPKFSHVTESEKTGKAFWKYVKKTFTSSSSLDKQRAELESELDELLKDVLQGLQSINPFLEAVEKLAATSPYVFLENQLIQLSQGVGLDYVRVMVVAAKEICSLVLEFKCDANLFFLPRLQNVEVLVYQLEKYIQTSSRICENFRKSFFGEFDLDAVEETEVDLGSGSPEGDVQRMLDHINQMVEIRDNPYFRTAFLFQQKPGQQFVTEFKVRQPRMLTFLEDLEETAVQLDRMNTGARISTVAGSSVGAVGGVLSIVGLALIPFTAGVSLSLTLAGVGLGITSGVNSMVTTATEIGVNATQQKKANNVFQSFVEDVQSLQDCAAEAGSSLSVNEEELGMGVAKVISAGCAVGRGIDLMVDGVSAVKLLKSEEVASSATKVLVQEGKVLRNIPRVASDIPDLGQAAAKGATALSGPARAGLIGLNALFLGMDVFMICKESINLSKGSETQVSKFIRARSALWTSVIASWEKICDCLVKGLPTLEKKETILETPFYPEVENQEEE